MKRDLLNARIADIPLPERMKHLPLSSEGYPVPWFVAWVDDEPDFRIIDTPKFGIALREKRCWLCGHTMGKFLAFVIGPMCMVNRVSAEPPSHRACAEYAIRACPFLSQPRMRRNKKDMPEQHEKPGGVMIERNPGIIVLWVTSQFRPFREGRGGKILYRVGLPSEVQFYREGRTATRAEILESINSGMPLLQGVARQDGAAAEAELKRQYDQAMRLLPV